MFYPYFRPMDDAIYGCADTVPPGPHTVKEIVNFCIANPDFENLPPRVYSWIPCEDDQQITDCHMWSIITIDRKLEHCVPLLWGKGQKFQAPFILCRNRDGLLHPWGDVESVSNIMEFALNRQEYWGMSDAPVFDNLHDFIKSLTNDGN